MAVVDSDGSNEDANGLKLTGAGEGEVASGMVALGNSDSSSKMFAKYKDETQISF